MSQPRNAAELELELNAKLEQITYFKTQLNELSIRKDALDAAVEIAEKDPNRSNRLIVRQDSTNSGAMNLVLDESSNSLKIELAEVEASINSIKK